MCSEFIFNLWCNTKSIYSFKIIPKIGEAVLKDHDSYQYLVESIKKFPNQEKFLNTNQILKIMVKLCQNTMSI